MKILRAGIAVLCVCLCAASAASAQGEVAVGARLTTGIAKLGEELALLIQVENVRTAEVVGLPSVDGLAFGRIEGPMKREEYQLSPGRRTVTVTWSWRVPIRTLQAGDYDIPGIELDVNGSRVVTEPMRLTVVVDLKGAELGFFEVRAPTGELVEGETFELEFTFGWDEAATSRVDFANLILPWWGKTPELLELELPAGLTAQEVQINLNGRQPIAVEELARAKRGARSYRAFRLRRVFLATRPTRLEFPEPFLEFGQTEHRGLFGDRRKKETFFVSGPAIAISVGRLPEEGRPLDFTGAIGTLEARADAEPRDVDAGDSIKVSVTWSGKGNHPFYDPPDLSRDPAFAGFRVFGVATEDKSINRRKVVYDLAPLSEEVSEIPAIRLPVYDTLRRAYLSVATDEIPIRVRALEGAAFREGEEDETFAPDILDIAMELERSGASDAPAPSPAALALVGAGVAVLWLALRTVVRRRRGDPDAPLERRRRRAEKSLARDLASARDAAEELQALLRFLSARTREPEWAWVGRDPLEHVEAEPSGERVEELRESARELSETLARLERSVYSAGGNGDGRPKRDEILTLAHRLVRGGL